MKVTIAILVAIFSANSFSLEFSPQFEVKGKEMGFALQVSDFKFYSSEYNYSNNDINQEIHKNTSTIGFSWMPKAKLCDFANFVYDIGVESRTTKNSVTNFDNGEFKDSSTVETQKTGIKLGVGIESYLNIDSHFGFKVKGGLESFDFSSSVETKASVGIVYGF